MSLYSTLFAGIEQGDVAMLQADGHTYRCLVYLNRAYGRIDAICWVENEGAGEEVVFENIIVEATDADFADPVGIGPQNGTHGYPLDCPRILASGTSFVVHWLQATQTNTEGDGSGAWPLFSLYRATMDMESFDADIDGWTQQGFVGLHEPWALYDAQPVIGSTDFVVARATDDDEITVQRFTGFTWLDNDWDATITRAIAARVLAVYAHHDDNDVVVTYETMDSEPGPDVQQLWSTRLDADDGGSPAEVQTFTAFDSARFANVGHCRVGDNRVVVTAEARADDMSSSPYTWIHHALARQINSNDATRVGEEHWWPHLNVVSRPWVYERGTTSPFVDVYVAVSYKSAYLTNDWEQAAVFVLNLDYDLWAAGNAGTALHARPILNVVSTGIPDARPAGWHPATIEASSAHDIHPTGPARRLNHISSVAGPPTVGADIKTRTFACGMWAELRSASGPNTTDGDDDAPTDQSTISELVPEHAGSHCVRVYMEDPWTLHRDDALPTQPVDNFKGVYSRRVGQSAEIGRSTFFSGGTPYLYDGRQTVEMGWTWRPEIIATTNIATGNLETGGTYIYYAVYSWRDSAGQLHRSGPSRPVTHTTDGSSQAIGVRVRTNLNSLRDSLAHYPMAQSIQIELFRTENGGTTFYRVWGSAATGMRPEDTPVNEDVGGNVWGVYVDCGGATGDTLSDARLVLNDLGPYQFDAGGALVASGAQLPTITPATTACTTWRNRLWAADALDPALLWYSDEILPDYGGAFYQAPQFFGTQQFRVGEIGEITALVAMDEYLIVFTADSIHTVRAADADFGLLDCEATRRPGGVGCIDPRSVVVGPAGIYFQSAKGYYLLSGGGEATYVGAGVEDDIREAGNVRSAVLLEDRTQLRLACNGRPVTTYTTTFTLNGSGVQSGDWGITIDSVAAVWEADPLENDEEIAATQLTAQLQAELEGVLRPLVAEISVDVNEITVEWLPDVVPDYGVTEPSGASIAAVDTSVMETQPWVLIYDTLLNLWSRAELVQTSSTARMSEVVDAYAWNGETGTRHVVLTQGALLIERGEGEALEFADETSVANVGVPIRVRTAWLSFSGLAGVQRVRRITVVADKPNATGMFADLYFDQDGDRDDPERQIGIEWASPAHPDPLIKPRIQRCSAIQVEIYEDSGVATTENIAITGLIFEVGRIPGTRRVADAQIGT